MGSSERRTREKEAIRQQILSAALRLFLNEGLEQVTLRRISSEIEYSPAGIYRYFASRDDILWALCSDGFNTLDASLARVRSRDPRRRLQGLGIAYIRFAAANPALYDLMFLQSNPLNVARDDPRWSQYAATYRYLLDAVQECQSAGHLKGVSADATAFGLWSTLHGMVSLVIKDRCLMYSPLQIRLYGLEALNFFLKSLFKA